jgi:CRP-like cAMP-binding protein
MGGEQGVLRSISRANWQGNQVRNRILLSLQESEFQVLRPLLNFHAFQHHAVLHEPGESLEFIHFPNRGLVSIFVSTKNGKMVEVAIVGHEGFVGASSIVGLSESPNRAIVQMAGDGFRIRVADMQNVMNTRLQATLNRYAAIQGIQSAQNAACNRLHGVEQRLARWLLMMHKRVGELSVHITHDSFAKVLGTDRPSVSLAANRLQARGAIEYRRGAVGIVNVASLEETSCECYNLDLRLDELLDI